MMMTDRATVGDTEPCPACNHVKEPAKRLHAVACCGLASHHVYIGPDYMRMRDVLVHLWLDTNEYSAVEKLEISEEDALAWLERAHAGETPRRLRIEGVLPEHDRWNG